MEGIDYFYELYEGLPRGGPGDNQSTKKAYSMMKDLPVKPMILDIGCGPGMQTIELAKLSNGSIIALDNYQPFLDQLMIKAKKNGVDELITPTLQSMDEMNFKENTFDLIWSEGALYHLGFLKGLQECYRLLKPKAYLAVTEAVYLKPNPPQPVIDFWKDEYPDIRNLDDTIKLIKKADFKLLSHFTLPNSSWMDNFYDPMAKRIDELKKKYAHNEIALHVLTTAEQEIDIFKKYSDYFGYEFFIMKRKN